MSKLIATVEHIESCDNLNIVTFRCTDITLKMMSLDLDENIKVGKRVVLGCKPSSVAIAKDFSGSVSYSNQIPSVIEDIEIGELLCSLRLKFDQFFLESLITKSSVKKMELKIGDSVTAFIKASELSILESLDD